MNGWRYGGTTVERFNGICGKDGTRMDFFTVFYGLNGRMYKSI